MVSRLIHARVATYLEIAALPIISGSTVVLAKAALVDLGPVTLTALRFTLAALILLPVAPRQSRGQQISRQLWVRLAVMGITFYVIGNGSLFVGLRYVPATTAAVLLSLTPLAVLVLSVPWLREVPSPLQLVAVAGCIGGSVLFFSRGIEIGEPLGITIVSGGVIGSAIFTILARGVARDDAIDTISLTAIPLAIGAALLLLLAPLVEGMPRFSLTGWSIVVVLALLNTVGALLLYTHLLRRLTALELATVLSVNPVVTAILAWIFLGNRLSALELCAMLVVVVSAITMQLAHATRPESVS